MFSSHSFWTSSLLDVPAGVTQEECHTEFLIRLVSAVRTSIFLARRIQPFLSLVDCEVGICVLTISFSSRWAFLVPSRLYPWSCVGQQKYLDCSFSSLDHILWGWNFKILENWNWVDFGFRANVCIPAKNYLMGLWKLKIKQSRHGGVLDMKWLVEEKIERGRYDFGQPSEGHALDICLCSFTHIPAV